MLNQKNQDEMKKQQAEYKRNGQKLNAKQQK